MSSKIFYISLFTCLSIGLYNSSFAQRKPRAKQVNQGRDSTKTNGNNSDYFSTPNTNAGVGAGNAGAGNNGTGRDTAKPNNNGGLNVPLKYVPSNGNILTDTVAPSMKPEDAIDRSSVKERTPLDYQYIREDDAVYVQKVWRVIDTREKMNLVFRNPAEENGNSENFLAILYKSVAENDANGSHLIAFKDDRFSQPYLNPDDFKKKFSGGLDTVEVKDLQGNTISKEVRPREFKIDSVFQYEIKEEWIFDKQTSRLYVRILGIAPMMRSYASDGTALSKDLFPLFWVYYPDLRPILAKREVYNGKNFGARMSWEELFESRMFTSFIIKSTLDNPFNQSLAEMYPNNTLFRLLEGDHTKDKIFDYEQSLWQY